MDIEVHRLNGPLYRLYHFRNVYDEQIFTRDAYLLAIAKGYKSEEHINNLLKTLEWAIENPNYDFQSLGYEDVPNAEIYYYLKEFYKRLMGILKERDKT